MCQAYFVSALLRFGTFRCVSGRFTVLHFRPRRLACTHYLNCRVYNCRIDGKGVCYAKEGRKSPAFGAVPVPASWEAATHQMKAAFRARVGDRAPNVSSFAGRFARFEFCRVGLVVLCRGQRFSTVVFMGEQTAGYGRARARCGWQRQTA